MKFGKEYASQILPEWQQAYMDYANLKTLLKDIQRMKQTAAATPPAASLKGAVTTLHRSFSGLIHKEPNLSTSPSKRDDIENQFILVSSVRRDGNRCYETTFLKIAEEGGECDREFFRKLDSEFNKVDQFYRGKVQEVMAEAETLSKQMDALIAFRIKAKKLQGFLDAIQPARSGSSKRIVPVDLMKDKQSNHAQSSDESNDEISEQQINNHQQEVQNNNSNNIKLVPLEILSNVKLNKTLDTPAEIIKGFANVPKQADANINKENLQKVEKQLKRAFVEFYRKIRHLKGYSFMNVLAFSKIMKKYDKITSRKASVSYMKMVDNSYLGSSDEVTNLMERVEAVFVEYFSNSNRSKGMDILRPKAKKEKHSISFTLGLFVGCSFALVLALVFVIRVRDIFDKSGTEKYMENMFPLYSLFAFIVLHMLMYAANIFFWKRYRVNYSFIFGFKQGTELGYREVLLVSFGITVLGLISVLSNLDMEMDPETNDYEALTELLPLGLLLLIILVMICPLNIIYRSSRFFFLTCLFHSLCAPLYKVTLQDFVLADQLTSQVQAFRSFEFYICYYGWGDYKHRENSCKLNHAYSTFYYIVAALPYFTRLLQCLRRLFEEKDAMQGYNGLKYFLIIVAINTKTAYTLNKGLSWRIIAAVSSAIATLYCLYWDLVIDWGLLQRRSKNRWLRDKLLVPNKSVYFVAMGLNVMLRFAWLQTILDLHFPSLHRETLITIVASLEIIRRGIWNFFRLENEHLNNVGKYRAFKSVPLPFTYYDDEDNDQ